MLRRWIQLSQSFVAVSPSPGATPTPESINQVSLLKPACDQTGTTRIWIIILAYNINVFCISCRNIYHLVQLILIVVS